MLQHSYEYRPSWMATIGGAVERSSAIQCAAGICVWATAAKLRGYTTYQLQRWIVAARFMLRATDRDGEIHLDKARAYVIYLLEQRRAWTFRRTRQQYDIDCERDRGTSWAVEQDASSEEIATRRR